jgi:hypothetical protein
MMVAELLPKEDTMTDGERRTMHVALILDRSGSMEGCRDATISGFNEYTGEVRRKAEQDELRMRVTLVAFNGDVRTVFVDEPLGRLRRLNRKTYVPDGSTAMLDAVGDTLQRLQPLDGEEQRFLVCIISDGYENASRRYTYPDIAERIQRLTGTGRWTFTYLMSNQDLSVIERELHLDRGNMAAYVASDGGTRSAWARHTESTVRHLEAVSLGMVPEPFYGPTEEEER